MRIKGVHASGRYDRSPQAFAANIERTRALGSFVTRTEVGNIERRQELFRDDGWAVHHPRIQKSDGTAVFTDSAVEWDTEVWQWLDTGTQRLTTINVFTSDGDLVQPSTLVYVVLRHRETDKVLLLASAHRYLRNTPRRLAGRGQEARALRKFLKGYRAANPAHEVAVQYDENSNQRLRVNRLAVWRIIRGLGVFNIWGRRHRPDGALPKRGTHGRSLLDTALTTMGGWGQPLKPDGSSDHNPFRVFYDLP